MVPWAYPSPQPKRHLDWFSRFLHSSLQTVPILYSGLLIPPENCPVCMVSWAHLNLQPKQHLIRFSYFCTAVYCDRMTDDATGSVTIGSIYVHHLFSRLLSHTKFISSSMQTTRNFTWLCRLAAIHVIFLHFSLVWTLFTFGSVKMAWPSTLLNQLSFCLAHHRDSNLCLVSSLSMSLGQSFQFLIRSRYSVQHLIPTSQWKLTPKLYPVPAFIKSAHLNRFVRPWMTAWLVRGVFACFIPS